MSEIILKYCFINEVDALQYSLSYEADKLGIIFNNVDSCKLHESMIVVGDVILELNGLMIGNLNLSECDEKIRKLVKSNGCILTLMNRNDFDIYTKSGYLIDSTLNNKVLKEFKAAVNQFYGSQQSSKFRIYNIELLKNLEGIRLTYHNTKSRPSLPNTKKGNNMRRASTQTFSSKSALFDEL